MKLRSYPKIWNIGHPNLDELFTTEVVVQEKIDGSQFSFGVREGELFIRSKGAEIFLDAPQKMFLPAIKTVVVAFEAGKLTEGWTYRGEAVCKLRHNALTYNRTPVGFIVLYDIDINDSEARYNPLTVASVAEGLGMEDVPTLATGTFTNADELRDLLYTESCLGGPKVEGIVIKNYNHFCQKTGKQLMGKLVSEAFREAHSKVKYGEKSKKDIVQELVDRFRTEARWAKAVQHLRDSGQLEGSPRDIGKLMKEVQTDALAELEEEIKATLFKNVWGHIGRGIARGFPEWYKEQLLEQQKFPEPSISD